MSESREGLQIALNDLSQYCKKWGVVINILKTKIMVVRKGGRLSKKGNWFLEGEQIDIVPHFKYLGCYLSSSGSFSKCISKLTNL